eukprot:m.44832 g.44832  ORF g.44832 m.44832 type:complete len:223 (-) comp8575_c0_seq1:4209-4877(-)
MLACVYVVAFVGGITAALVAAHTAIHSFSSLQAFLALFEVVNLMICLWEIALFCYAGKVANEYREFREKWGTKGQLPQPMLLFQDISLSQALSFSFWSTIWSTYALMDPAYQDCTSWGFWIDTGNGFTTLIPTIVTAVGMTWDIMPPRILGLLGFVVHYQEFYGTVIYFCQYLYNERYVDQPTSNKLIVALSNTYWMLAPGIAMWAFYDLIETNSAAVFRTH